MPAAVTSPSLVDFRVSDFQEYQPFVETFSCRIHARIVIAVAQMHRLRSVASTLGAFERYHDVFPYSPGGTVAL